MDGQLLQFFFICIESVAITQSIHGKNFSDLLNICENCKTILSHSLCCLRYLLYCYDLKKVESADVFINFIYQFLIYGLSSLHALQILMQSLDFFLNQKFMDQKMSASFNFVNVLKIISFTNLKTLCIFNLCYLDAKNMPCVTHSSGSLPNMSINY